MSKTSPSVDAGGAPDIDPSRDLTNDDVLLFQRFRQEADNNRVEAVVEAESTHDANRARPPVMKDENEYPRIRNLPSREQEAFRQWLGTWGCTSPAVEGVPRETQDWYYPWDYWRWKAQRPPTDETDLDPGPLLAADEQAVAWTQALGSEASDLREMLRQVFTTEAAIDDWLASPHPSLGGLSPRERASQPDGLEPVRNRVRRMICGEPP